MGVAIILAVATAFEVGLYYITKLPHPVYVALLLFFMVAKFSLVVLWFMHLRFDSRLFRRLFVTGIILVTAVLGDRIHDFRIGRFRGFIRPRGRPSRISETIDLNSMQASIVDHPHPSMPSSVT